MRTPLLTPSLRAVPRPDAPRHPERRRQRRTRFRGAMTRYVACPSFHPSWALVTDVSADGVGLVLDCAPDVGQALLVELSRNLRLDGLTRVARVVRASQLPAGAWAVGCAFTRPLSLRELWTAWAAFRA